MIEIENGCLRDAAEPLTFYYVKINVSAYLADYQSLLEVNDKTTAVRFTVEEGQHPEVGDYIINGKLVKRTTPKVNNDKSMWLNHYTV